MRKLLGGFAAILGLFATSTSGWMLVRGPLFGGQAVNSETMMAALGAFLVGIVLFGWGSVRWSEIGARI
jgi:hypothetical protein